MIKAPLRLMAVCLLAGGGLAMPPAHAQSAKNRPAAHNGNEGDLPTPLPLEEESEHVVVPGETLGGVARRAKVPRILIIEANHLKAPHYPIHAGQKLFLPRTRHHVVKGGETGFDIAYRYGVSYASIAVANGLAPDARLREGQKLLIPTVLKPDKAPKADNAAKAPRTGDDAKSDDAAIKEQPAAAPRFLWPMEGRMRRGFVAKTRDGDGGDFHNGLDLVAKEGETVRTSAPGEVIFAGREPDSFGNLVVIDHGKGWQTAYGFLSQLTVKRGDMVKAHERVGLVGHSGRATRDELHFEIRHSDRPVDPVPLLPRRDGAKADKNAAEQANTARAANAPIETRQNAGKAATGKKPGEDEAAPKSKTTKAPLRR